MYSKRTHCNLIIQQWNRIEQKIFVIYGTTDKMESSLNVMNLKYVLNKFAVCIYQPEFVLRN